MAKKSANHRRTALMERQPTWPDVASVRVDYPSQSEVITHPTYTMRLRSLPHAARVEVSIDQGYWRPCRESLGLWWYDWSGYDSGEHEVVARMFDREGTITTCTPHQFTVKLPA